MRFINEIEFENIFNAVLVAGLWTVMFVALVYQFKNETYLKARRIFYFCFSAFIYFSALFVLFGSLLTPSHHIYYPYKILAVASGFSGSIVKFWWIILSPLLIAYVSYKNSIKAIVCQVTTLIFLNAMFTGGVIYALTGMASSCFLYGYGAMPVLLIPTLIIALTGKKIEVWLKSKSINRKYFKLFTVFSPFLILIYFFFEKNFGFYERHNIPETTGEEIFDGQREPLRPNYKEGIKTFLGIDNNTNGIRDDVEIYLNQNIKNSKQRAFFKTVVKNEKIALKYLYDRETERFKELFWNIYIFKRDCEKDFFPDDKDKDLYYSMLFEVLYNTAERNEGRSFYNRPSRGDDPFTHVRLGQRVVQTEYCLKILNSSNQIMREDLK